MEGLFHIPNNLACYRYDPDDSVHSIIQNINVSEQWVSFADVLNLGIGLRALVQVQLNLGLRIINHPSQIRHAIPYCSRY